MNSDGVYYQLNCFFGTFSYTQLESDVQLIQRQPLFVVVYNTPLLFRVITDEADAMIVSPDYDWL